MKKENQGLIQPSIKALLPIILFIVLFVGSGIFSGDFYMMPAALAFLIALMFALLQNNKYPFEIKLKNAAAGAGDSNIITMCLIYLLAGGFSAAVTTAGGVTSTVNLALTYIPANFAVIGLFLMGCFISISMGTSMGTIAALAPIAVDISAKTGFGLPLCIGAVVSGAMFGDNLSMISDTTIAAIRTQGCEMKDKFKANFLIVVPAALLTLIALFFLTSNSTYIASTNLPYSLLQVSPYLFILLGALIGINVFILLVSGIVISVLVGFYSGSIALSAVFTTIGNGMASMYEITIIAILVACISALVKQNGGFDWVLQNIQKHLSGYKGAQFGLAALVSLMNVATANNTVAIVLAGPLAKQIATTYHISPKRSASILDIFASVVQGLLPYGAQLLSAAALTGLTPFNIIPFVFYPVLMGISAVLFIAFIPEKRNK